jgi:hypothetical protein
MKKGWNRIILLLAALMAIACLCIFVLIPKAANLTLPYRWNRIPLGEKRDITHQFFGKPADTAPQSDTWKAERDNGYYLLHIDFDKDSVAQQYHLYFHYKLGFFNKEYLLNEGRQ